MFMGDLKEFFGLWHLHVGTFVLKADRAAGLEAHSEPHGDLSCYGFQSPGTQFPMLSGPSTVKLSNPSCTGELSWTLQNVSVMTILKRKQKKTVRKK